MSENPRARKIADRIKVIVASLIERGGIRDPRLGFVTITDVRVTGDLQHASVFYTVFGTDEERAASSAALQSATGTVRKELGQLGLRLTPTVEFIADAVPENAATIDHLLTEARQRDAATRAEGASAQYAGDADPYRAPKDDETDA